MRRSVNWTIIGPDNGLLYFDAKAIIWTYAWLFQLDYKKQISVKILFWNARVFIQEKAFENVVCVHFIQTSMR